MPWKGRWLEWTDADQKSLVESGNNENLEYARARDRAYRIYCRNRLAQFLPHCDGKDFINDRTNDLVLLTKGNQQGGTAHGVAFVLFRALRCDPAWHCFQHHGINHYDFQGPKRVLVATWSWDNMRQAVWPEYQKMLPREELGVYAPDYGMYPDEDPDKARTLSFGSGQSKTVKLLVSGSELFFRVYTQPQHAFETTQFDIVHADEQMPESKFDGVDERGRTRTNFQVAFTLTGHKLPGFSDTGKSGWIYRKLYMGVDLKGHTLGKYKLWIDGVPDAIYPKERKQQAYEKHVVIPKKNKDKRAQREGEARYYGGFEGESETVLDKWDRETHLVAPFKVPVNCTRYRGIDHGRVRPFACLLAAMMPWGDMLFYREYYERGKTVPVNCKGVLEMCGNTRIKIADEHDEESGTSWPVYEEQFVGTQFAASVLDPRSYGTKAADRNCNLGQMYNDCGLFVTSARAKIDANMIPEFQRWLEVDYNRKHFMWHAHQHKMISDADYANWFKLRGGDIMGGSRIAVFADMKFFQTEIETWTNKGETDKPKDENNHLMDAAMYIISENPQYMGSDIIFDGESEDDAPRSRITGY